MVILYFPCPKEKNLMGLCIKHSYSWSKGMGFHSNPMMGLCGKGDRFI